MRHLSPAGRWWAMPVGVAAFCTVMAVTNVVSGNWVVAALLVALAFITVMDRRTQRLAYKAGYWRGCYEQGTGTRSDRVFDGWEPEPWQPLPPAPWEHENH